VQIALDKGDRKLLIWVGIVLLLVIMAFLFYSSQGERDSGVPSSYSAEASGAKAAYLFLEEEGYRVERWERSPKELPNEPRNSVLVLAGSFRPPDKEEKNALEQFLKRGGKILASGYSASYFLPRTDLLFEYIPGAVWREYAPLILSPLTRGGPIKMSPTSYWANPAPDQIVHYAHEGKGIVVSYKVGQGEVIWWGANTPLTNAGIKESGNLELLLNSLGNSKDVRILWDEFFHSYQVESINYFVLPPIWSGLAQCGLVFLALLLTYSRRNAPVRPLNEPSRLSPLEFVHTLGGLYRRAKSTRTALEILYNRFRFLLSRRLGLRGDTVSTDLVRAARNRLDYGDPDLEKVFQEVETNLKEPDLSEDKALNLTQRLSHHAHNMKLILLEGQENISHDRQQGFGPRAQ
jgi:hypothetical protein